MSMNLGAVGAYVKAHPKAAMIAGGLGGGAVLLGVLHKGNAKPKEKETSAAGKVAPLESQPIGQPADYSNYPVINIQTPAAREPAAATEPGRSFHSIVRDGRTMKVTAGPAGICPPGYVSAQQEGQPARCTLANDANKKTGQRTSFVPSLGQHAIG